MIKNDVVTIYESVSEFDRLTNFDKGYFRHSTGCSSMETYFYENMTNKEFTERGAFIYFNHVLVGFVKLNGNVVMLSLSSENSDARKYGLKDYMTYKIPEKLADYITKKRGGKNWFVNDFYRINIISNFRLAELRPIAQGHFYTQSIKDRLSSFHLENNIIRIDLEIIDFDKF